MKICSIDLPPISSTMRRRLCSFAAAVYFISCGKPPTFDSNPSMPPAPVVTKLQGTNVYGPLDFFKRGETVLTATEAELKSAGDLIGLRSTPVGAFDISISVRGDTARGMRPRMIVIYGNKQIADLYVGHAMKNYRIQNIAGTGDTLLIKLANDFYDPNTKEDINLYIRSVTFSSSGSSSDTTKWRLVWDANIEADLAGYNVYSGIISRQYDQKTNVGLSTFYLLTFRDGVTRYFAVTAFDTAGNESGLSNEIVWTAPAPAPQDTTKPPEPKPDTTIVAWPDNKTLKMRVIYLKKDAAGKPLLPAIKLQMEKFDSLNAYGWLDRFRGTDYTMTDANDSTSVIEMNMVILKSGILSNAGKYAWNVRFRVRLENPTDATKATAWVYSDKSIHLLQIVNPLDGMPLLPTFRIILE